MAEQPLSVMLLGDSESGDFRALVESVRGWNPPAEIRQAADFAGFRRCVEDERWFPDLVVVLQAWPDQFSETEVCQLLAMCPLARLVCCFGPWSDSDGRTRSIWPAAVRVPLAAAGGRLARELALLVGGESGCALPLTASGPEIFTGDSELFGPPPRRKLSVAVISPDRAWKEMIEAAVRASELAVHSPESTEPPEAVIFDVDRWSPERSIALRAIRAADPGVRILAAAGFPRPDLAAALRDCGADDVWFKLAPIYELVETIARNAT
jgi:hypothetical protein